MKTNFNKLPQRAEDLTIAQIKSLATDAGLDRQVVERLIQKEIPDGEKSALNLRDQLFDGFMMLGGRWVQPTAADVKAAIARAEAGEKQAKREREFADCLQSRLMLASLAHERAQATELVSDEPTIENTAVADNATTSPSSADYA